ncbi:MAG TPA: mycofactocin precursor MftA [Acidimicrobiales bacterium]
MTVTTTEETITATTGDHATTATAPAAAAAPETLVESDLLVEDVSIDGMCGVY